MLAYGLLGLESVDLMLRMVVLRCCQEIGCSFTEEHQPVPVLDDDMHNKHERYMT